MSKFPEIATKMNSVVSSVIGSDAEIGFQKAYLTANAITELRTMLTTEYMKPIMALQGNKLGFKSDKVYPENIVKDCLIEAVFMGLQPYGNEFNIIAGNCYATKEGLGSLLKNIKGLNYEVVPELPRINKELTSAAVKFIINWNYNGQQGNKEIDIPVRMNRSMGTDAVIGKGIRKARKWLYDHITGNDIPEGNIEDIDFKYVKTQSIDQTQEAQERERLINFIKGAKSLDDLKQIESEVSEYDLAEAYMIKFEELKQ